jgi:hypothetical protein
LKPKPLNKFRAISKSAGLSAPPAARRVQVQRAGVPRDGGGGDSRTSGSRREPASKAAKARVRKTRSPGECGVRGARPQLIGVGRRFAQGAQFQARGRLRDDRLVHSCGGSDPCGTRPGNRPQAGCDSELRGWPGRNRLAIPACQSGQGQAAVLQRLPQPFHGAGGRCPAADRRRTAGTQRPGHLRRRLRPAPELEGQRDLPPRQDCCLSTRSGTDHRRLGSILMV